MCPDELCTIRSGTSIKKVNSMKLKKEFRKVTHTCDSYMSRAA